jgi:hypothetical protein
MPTRKQSVSLCNIQGHKTFKASSEHENNLDLHPAMSNIKDAKRHNKDCHSCIPSSFPFLCCSLQLQMPSSVLLSVRRTMR